MLFSQKNNKSYYCCSDLEENLVLHRDWYSICSMYGHINYKYRPIFLWGKKGFDYKNFLKAKKEIINNLKKGIIHPGCVGCKELKKKEWKGKCDKLYHMHFRLSKKCNAKCIYCLDEVDNITPDRLFFEDLKKLVKNRKVDKNALMEFGGGEFTLHEEFDKIFRFLLDNGFKRYKIFTSGLKYSKELEEALGFDQCEVIISPDAGDRETFIKIKQTDTYDRLWGNLERYVKAQNENKLQVKTKFLICRGINDTEKQIDLFLEKSKEIGIKKVMFDIEVRDLYILQNKFNEELLTHLIKLIKYAKNQSENKYNLIFEDFSYIQLLEQYFPQYWK